jgi:hypothetical protein
MKYASNHPDEFISPGAAFGVSWM